IGRSPGSRQSGTIDVDVWDYIRSRVKENRDQTVPWGFGVSQLPLVHAGGKYHFAAVTLHEPTLDSGWQLCDGNWNRNAIFIHGLDPRVFKVQVRINLPDSSD